MRDSISFSAQRGEIVSLIGANGSGKSTLLRTLSGLQKQLAGEIFFDGKRMALFSQKELSRCISFVSTENVKVPHMTVAELVSYGRFPYTGWLGKMHTHDHQMVMESLEKVGLLGFARRQIARLSDGERQKVLIARALAQDTPYIIMDEPTAFLDISNKYEIFHLLHKITRQHQKTVILSTHDLHVALHEMDKLWMLTSGGSWEGAPEDAALAGWLDQLFNTTHMGFDLTKGEFYFRKDHAGKAFVRGDGIPALWTGRALERKGFTITGEGEADLVVTLLKTGEPGGVAWQVTLKGEVVTFPSIHELISVL